MNNEVALQRLKPLKGQTVTMNWTAEEFLLYLFIAMQEVNHRRWKGSPLRDLLVHVVETAPYAGSIDEPMDSQSIYLVGMIAYDMVELDETFTGGTEALTERLAHTIFNVFAAKL